MSETPSGIIRCATAEDMDDIRGWVQTFRTSQSVIDACWNLGRLRAFVTTERPAAVAFLAEGATMWPQLLEVRVDLQGKGIGQLMWKDSLKRAKKAGVPCIEIECTPLSSIPFWERMGFALHRPEQRLAHFLIPRRYRRPAGYPEVTVTLRFFDEARLSTPQAIEVAEFASKALINQDGFILLPERIAVFTHSLQWPAPIGGWRPDPMVQILVDGTELFLGKAKSKEAQMLGVERAGATFFVDQLKLSV